MAESGVQVTVSEGAATMIRPWTMSGPVASSERSAVVPG